MKVLLSPCMASGLYILPQTTYMQIGVGISSCDVEAPGKGWDRLNEVSTAHAVSGRLLCTSETLRLSGLGLGALG